MAKTPSTQAATKVANEAPTERTPEEIQALFKTNTIAISKTGGKHWTGGKTLALAELTIKATSTGEETEFSPEFRDIMELVFNPSRDVKMRVLKRYAEAEEIIIDKTTEEAIDMLFDPGQFAGILAKIDDPETKTPLVVKKTKKNRNKILQGIME